MSMQISTTLSDHQVDDARLAEILANPGFGTHFTDHMFTVEWTPEQGWHDARVTLTDESAPPVGGPDADILALDAALTRLAVQDARRADVIELHYFGGLTYPEIAGALGISESTVHEDLRGARVWLLQQLGGAAAAT